ncbi:MAG: hypothetical protein M1831_006545 [Alyxoria varia]|nr:MAG: hypothetical protein M1831_006545 [Alyxoria varia]
MNVKVLSSLSDEYNAERSLNAVYPRGQRSDLLEDFWNGDCVMEKNFARENDNSKATMWADKDQHSSNTVQHIEQTLRRIASVGQETTNLLSVNPGNESLQSTGGTNSSSDSILPSNTALTL